MTRKLRNLAIAAALMLTLSATVGLAQLPDPGMTIDAANTALVVTDPMNDFLSPDGVTWGVVGKSVTENHTVESRQATSK